RFGRRRREYAGGRSRYSSSGKLRRGWARCYSLRSAIIGSTPAARRAGIQHFRDPGRQRDPDHDPDGGEPEPFAEEHRNDLSARRAERDTNADLTRSLVDRERHHRVDADRREQQRERAKDG